VGECGIGRECVGIVTHGTYPDYHWGACEETEYEDTDPNGYIWKPPHAYHKHPCVAVLGRGEEAEAELYDWLKWFDDNGFTVESGIIENAIELSPLEILFGKHQYARMVKGVNT
jgi:hypothetical protein